MIFLPIVERELRVASRKRHTFWLRVIVALVALVLASGFLALSAASGQVQRGLGRVLFGLLTWMNLAVALLAGLFFTADCLCEEKREGTLGFLFLTDLRGYDVVLGKLLATSLRGATALLAVFPVMALTLLLGGVTGAQFWKTVLALVNALLWSLSAGMLISAVSRDSREALGGTLLMVVLFAFGGPLIDVGIAGAWGRAHLPAFSLLSPGFVFTAASGSVGSAFWLALLCNQLMAWVLLGLASLLVPRLWQGKTARTRPTRAAPRIKAGHRGMRAMARRAALLERNPLGWLAMLDARPGVAWLRMGIPAGLLVSGLALTSALAASGKDWSEFKQGLLVLGWLWVGAESVVLWFKTGWEGAQAMVELRRTGMLELLMVTPLKGDQYIASLNQALFSRLGPPALALTLTSAVMAALSFDAPAEHALAILVIAGALVMIAAPLYVVELVSVNRLGMLFGLRTGKTLTAWRRTVFWSLIFPLLITLLPPMSCLWPLALIFFAVKGIITIDIANNKIGDELRKVVFAPPGTLPAAMTSMWMGPAGSAPPVVTAH